MIKNIYSINHKLLVAGVLMVASASFSYSDSFAARPMNRIRPAENTEQFAREAARVRLEKLGERLGLSESQMLKMREAQLKKEDKLKKQESKIQKAEEKMNSEKKKIASEENKIMLDYQKNLQKIMTSDQWQAYQMLLQQEAEAERQIEPPVTNPDVGPQEIETEGGFTGPAVKTPGPKVMY